MFGMHMTPLNAWLLIGLFVWACIVVALFTLKIDGTLRLSWWIVGASLYVPIICAIIAIVLLVMLLNLSGGPG